MSWRETRERRRREEARVAALDALEKNPGELYPYWDGHVMHLATRFVSYGVSYHPRCLAAWSPHVDGQVVANAVPTCLWCLVDARRV